MRRAVTLLLALLAGGAVGAAAAVAPAPGGGPGAAVPEAVTAQPPQGPREPVPAAPPPSPADQLLLVWTSGGLPDGAAVAVAGIPGVTAVTEVLGGRLGLVRALAHDGSEVERHVDGWAVPLDAIAVDPGTYGIAATKASMPAIAGLGPGEALLGATSAALRGIGAGGIVELAGGQRLAVAGVIEDVAVGAAEVVVHRDDADRLGIATPRYVLAQYSGERAAFEERVRAQLPTGTPVRVRGPGETPYLRHGDAVLPQSIVKARYGEFAYRDVDGERGFTIDPAWAADHIVAAEVPILGRVRCHRVTIEALAQALGALRDAGLGHLVDRDGYAGCWVPRLTAPGGSVSRHAWGIAVDLNDSGNPTGLGSGQAPVLVEAMRTAGFGWGGEWLVPDPMHFELVSGPRGTGLKARP